jgi:pyroglutamyl-peptidase
MQRLAVVTGFGPFEDVEYNPSADIARALEADPPPGIEVRAAELPVTFDGAPVAVRQAVEAILPTRPELLVGLGVQKEAYFRLERRARGALVGERTDNSGETASSAGVDAGPDMETSLDLEALADVLRAAGADDVRVSEDAGGYVCERTYHALLSAGTLLPAPAVFLHIPPAGPWPVERQVPIVRALVAALV